MSALILDKDFKYYGQRIDFKDFVFPSGCEMHIKLTQYMYYVLPNEVTLVARIKSSDDIMMLLLATDVLRRSGAKNIQLILPFLPYARQDRVMVSGEPLSIKVIADLINAQGYEKVKIFDPHSDVSLALINNAEAVSNHKFVAKVLALKTNYLIVSPDAGAYKKIFKLCEEIKYKDEIILCNKVRDVNTGNIVATHVSKDDFEGKDLYIVDDICDGGGTFILLAQELRKRNCGKINLIVSHGIFSKGEEVLKPHIDAIYTTDSVKNIVSNYIHQINLCDTHF